MEITPEETTGSDLLIDETGEGTEEQNEGMGPAAVSSTCANISAMPMETEASEAAEEEQPEEYVEVAEMANETCVLRRTSWQ